jgi:hypothetical protein
LSPQSGAANGLCCARDPWAKPATDSLSVERNFTEVCVFARPLAELPAPPTMRHHAETSATMIADLMLADLRLSHHTLVQQFDGISLRTGIRCGEAAACYLLPLICSCVPCSGVRPHARRHFSGKAAELAWRSSKGTLVRSRTRWAWRPQDVCGRAGIVLEPLLKSAGDRRRPRLPINDGELAWDLPGPENGPESSR